MTTTDKRTAPKAFRFIVGALIFSAGLGFSVDPACSAGGTQGPAVRVLGPAKSNPVNWDGDTPSSAEARSKARPVPSAARPVRQQAPTASPICLWPCTPDGPNNEFTVSVNYDQSIEDAIKSGAYDWSNSDINTAYFSASARNYTDPSLDGKVRVTIKLLNFNKDLTTEQVLTRMGQPNADAPKGYRPANLLELLALGAQQPELQRHFLIVGLGSSWLDPSGRRFVPFLHGDGAERGLGLGWTDLAWGGSWRFAVVRK